MFLLRMKILILNGRISLIVVSFANIVFIDVVSEYDMSEFCISSINYTDQDCLESHLPA